MSARDEQATQHRLYINGCSQSLVASGGEWFGITTASLSTSCDARRDSGLGEGEPI
jgi:hypothetical protein